MKFEKYFPAFQKNIGSEIPSLDLNIIMAAFYSVKMSKDPFRFQSRVISKVDYEKLLNVKK